MYINFGLPEGIRNGKAISVSNCLYSVDKYNVSAHFELKFSSDL